MIRRIADPFAAVDWPVVRQHYEARLSTHKRLVRLHAGRQHVEFARLALGVADPCGNFSAAEHNLGPRILNSNTDAEQRVFTLGGSFLELTSAHRVPALIRTAQVAFLGISVGSEISCMVNPRCCWVTNTRTVWAHLLVKYDDSVDTANEALDLYRVEGVGEMAYRAWAAIHRELDTTMTRIVERGSRCAHSAGVPSGEMKYLWADAIADSLYQNHHE